MPHPQYKPRPVRDIIRAFRVTALALEADGHHPEEIGLAMAAYGMSQVHAHGGMKHARALLAFLAENMRREHEAEKCLPH